MITKESKALHPLILAAMKEHHIGRLVAAFEGSGDSGGFEEITAYQDQSAWDETRVDLEKIDLGKHKIHTGTDYSGANPQGKPIFKEERLSLAEACQEIGYAVLESRHSGWEIDAGSSGEIVFYLDGRIALKFVEHVEEYDEEVTL
jgi:hypothetical protein